MKKYIYIGLTILVLLIVIGWQRERIRVISDERSAYKQNTHNLLGEIEGYQTKDSLNAVSVGQLQLKLSEVNKYRAEDMKLIESLKVDKKRLQQFTTAQTQTTYELKGEFKESVVSSNRFRDEFLKADSAFNRIYKDKINSLYQDTLKCIKIHDEWFDLSGCIESNFQFTGIFENRDSLLYVEHIIPKRFWFIKWGVKERRQDIVSRNPHTKIVGAEFITIRKK